MVMVVSSAQLLHRGCHPGDEVLFSYGSRAVRVELLPERVRARSFYGPRRIHGLKGLVKLGFSYCARAARIDLAEQVRHLLCR